jgi:hypothetical protein
MKIAFFLHGIILSFVAGLAVRFSTLSHKRHDFKKEFIEHKICVPASPQLLCETFLIRRRIQRDIIINVQRSSCQVPVILVRFYGDLNFLDRFSKNAQMSDFMKIRQVGPSSMRTDGWTDMTKQFCLRAKKKAGKNRRQWCDEAATSWNSV